MRTLSIQTTTHGRVLVEDAQIAPPFGVLLVFHGYAQSADEALEEVRKIPGVDRWTTASVQGLHRFYTRGDQRVIASWMTRQDRDEAIADNIEYVNRAIDAIDPDGPIVFVGFSQGVPMAYRAALAAGRRAAGVIALGGDMPPELKTAERDPRWPPVLVGAGDQDAWFTAAKVAADEAFLRAKGVPHEIVRFAGGHEWTDEFRATAGRWLQRVIQAAATSNA